MAIYSYKTEPIKNYSNLDDVKGYQEGLKKVRSYLGQHYDLVIDGKRIMTDKVYTSLNPNVNTEVVGTISQASIEEAQMAMEVSLKRFKTWSKTDVSVRSDVLFKAAAIIRKRRFEFNALLSLEAGKPWVEADGDIGEAIDFLEYYGRQILEINKVDDKILSRRNLERNEYRYIPLGVGVIIAPWNFPLAILAGMTSAAIVSGNTVIVKPASTTQVIAYKFVEVMEEAGLPNGVLNFVPGKGSEVGDYLVNHPQTRFVSFTGSKDVGVEIYEKAAKVHMGQKWLKRVIAEMGGKDAIIVDSDVDLDFAAQEIVTSAFGFSGQKCSACSRAIVVESVYDELIIKIKELTSKIQMGNVEHFENKMGPVNDINAFRKVTSYFEVGQNEGRLLIGGHSDDSVGYFIEPTVYVDVEPTSTLMQEEIFGPILAVCKVKDFDEALEVANNTEYGLTGAVISSNREHLERAKEEFHVGNLYLNRKCTGAIVGYQPFGGFNMSGTDSKAGGPDYLLLHMQGQSITEQF
ncbi:MAG: L-glutamate gamma-semialdehyde dehydrogenase [Erysipelothrix sp.]|nr:L-glutamate gamma-semialdehyde dehydrogenase [Erysipelothrix sp.]